MPGILAAVGDSGGKVGVIAGELGAGKLQANNSTDTRSKIVTRFMYVKRYKMADGS